MDWLDHVTYPYSAQGELNREFYAARGAIRPAQPVEYKNHYAPSVNERFTSAFIAVTA